MRRTAWMLVLVGCGAAAPPIVEPVQQADAPMPQAPLFAAHPALTLRSIAATATAARRAESPRLYAELAADGSMTGTRCGATRFTDEGVLEREGAAVARIVRAGDALAIETAEGVALGWHIVDGTLTGAGDTRFTIASGTITPSDPELPAVTIEPATTPDSLALAVFAALLVCDDLGP